MNVRAMKRRAHMMRVAGARPVERDSRIEVRAICGMSGEGSALVCDACGEQMREWVEVGAHGRLWLLCEGCAERAQLWELIRSR